jgi:hypothetical protein
MLYMQWSVNHAQYLSIHFHGHVAESPVTLILLDLTQHAIHGTMCWALQVDKDAPFAIPVCWVLYMHRTLLLSIWQVSALRLHAPLLCPVWASMKAIDWCALITKAI